MAIVVKQLALLALVSGVASQNTTLCGVAPTSFQWTANAKCTGSGLDVTSAMPASMKTQTGCAAAAVGATAVNTAYVCVLASGCTSTSSADCKCSVHTSCDVTANTGDFSCLKVADTASCPAPSPSSSPSEASAASSKSTAVLVILLALVSFVASQNTTLCGAAPTSFQWTANAKCTGSALDVTSAMPASMKTKTGCAAAAVGATAVNTAYVCVLASGCTSTSSADCKCSVHTSCDVTAHTGDFSCLKVTDTASCPAPSSPEASAASSKSTAVLIIGVVAGIVIVTARNVL